MSQPKRSGRSGRSSGASRPITCAKRQRSSSATSRCLPIPITAMRHATRAKSEAMPRPCPTLAWVMASPDGLALLPYTGPALTVGRELNKLAANIGFGRDAAGIHWRSDIIEGLKLGEAVAIGILTDLRATYNEDFPGLTLTTFEGTTITI